MQTLLFTTFLKPGMLAPYKKFLQEIVGPRKAEYKDLLKRYGLITTKAWHEKIEGKDLVTIMHEAEEDALERLKGWDSSTNPFDLWFGEQLNQCYEKVAAPVHLLVQFDPRD